MADQAITALPKKTYSGSSQIAATDYLLGIDSAEGYQMLIQDLGEYIINRATASLAGSTQTLASAISALNSNLVFDSNALSQSRKSTVEYLDSLKAGCIVQAHTWVKLSDMPSELTDGLMSVVFIADKGNRNYDYVIVNKNGDQWLAYPNGNTTGNRTLNWVKQPTRAEVNALNSKNYTDQANGNSLLDFVATLAKGTYNFRLDNAPEAPVTGGITYTVIKTHNVGDTRCSITALPMDTSSPDIYTAFIGQNATSITWQKQPTRAEMDTLKVGTPINHMRFFGNNNKTYDILRFCYDESESEYIQVIFDVNDKSIALYKKPTDGTETFIGKVTLT